MDKNGKPKDGRWSFDEENRKKLPKDIKIPSISRISHSKHTNDLKKFRNLIIHL